MSLVTINGYTNTALKLWFLGHDIKAPKPKTNKVSIPLTDGDIDLTEELSGTVRFNNRTITMRFELNDTRANWPADILYIRRKLHGKNVTVIFADDPDYYWYGRCSVSALTDNGSTCSINMDVDALPFKRTNSAVFAETITVSGTATKTITLTNMRGYPTFVPTASMTVSDGIETYTITESVNKAYGLELLEGANKLTFTGSGSVTVTVIGGDL